MDKYVVENMIKQLIKADVSTKMPKWEFWDSPSKKIALTLEILESLMFIMS